MAEQVLSVKGLVKRFGGLVATDYVDFDIDDNQIHALIGPNGAGKTTFVSQLAGGLHPDDGSISFYGSDITRLSMADRAHMGLVRSYQITSIFRNLTVYENLAISVQSRLKSTFNFFGKSAADRLREEVAAVALRIELADELDTLACHLSYGQQRQLEIGLALALNPRLLLLDEPMAGLSPDQVPWFVDFIKSLKGKDLSILLIEHDMDAVFKLSDRISVLVSGKRIFSGTPDEVKNSAEVKRAYLGD
ncbi:ABC transporter ATP-binding protein [Noviherbaspirillum denitrificans]|uniref:ABC transporter ATP-binding protein n=1 Tax=Noviherbaspirillum denitrificans TaxID=1968433 RepID=A0A254TE87_9BURK|nr:ABC transporter ATP-binding protein [Noviherbaspirillum denitrificans]OWW19632.1 ABC transporter ATP-binding protein [Noviherbaspirillum denitrificans]